MYMELRDNLKRLRRERGLTQAQLAEKLFVSRSTVAKWENGLGLPSAESMAALEEIFGVPMQELATAEPETVIVEKNRRLHLIWQITSWVLILALSALSFVLPIAIIKGEYGFTPDMAAGSYADKESIDTGDYRIYYYVFEGDFEDGRHWVLPQGYKPVKKHFWGSTVAYDDVKSQIVTKNNYVVGRLYTIKGKDGYYHLLKKTLIVSAEGEGEGATVQTPEELLTAETVTVGGVDYPLQRGFFFVTDEPIRYFKIGDQFYDVIE